MQDNNRKELLLAVGGFIVGAAVSGLMSHHLSPSLLVLIVSVIIGGSFGVFAVINPVNFGEFIAYALVTLFCFFTFSVLAHKPAVPEIIRHWLLPMLGSLVAGGCVGKLISLIFRRDHDAA